MTVSSSPSLPACRILIVEDDIENRALASGILGKSGCRVLTAGDGRDAVALCEESVFDAIVMDIQMPAMDGLEATARIRAKGKNRNTPIIAFTALGGDAIREQCRAHGMDDFLAKPSPPRTLVELVRHWIAKRPLILVVDDSRDSRALLRRHLKEYRTIFARNGVEAIGAVRDHRVALVLMDMEMPVMDGYTAARAIASLPSAQKLPIIAMTSHEGDKEVGKCLKSGCAAFLQKPVDAGLLGAALERYLPAPLPGKTHLNAPGKPVVTVDPDLREIIPGYFEHRKEDITEIDRLLAEGDFREIRRIGHSMKGSGGGYGFPDISAIGGKIEAAAEKRDSRKILQLKTLLEDYLASVSIIYREPS